MLSDYVTIITLAVQYPWLVDVAAVVASNVTAYWLWAVVFAAP